MVKVDYPNTLVDAVYAHYEKRNADEESRPHLGASQIGKKCEREIWYRFRWVLPEKFPGRILRLFETGKLEEQRIVLNLRALGLVVRECDELSGRQFSYFAMGGHFGGSIDALGIGFEESPRKTHVLEFKTHNDKSFKVLVKLGLKSTKPEHYDQMQTYMYLSGYDRAVYIAVNKNTDEMYYERIKLDRKHAEEIVDKAGRVIYASVPPPRVSTSPMAPPCLFCNYKLYCRSGYGTPEFNCRTCLHSTAVEDGSWHCAHKGRSLSIEEQHQGCDHHLFIPELLNRGEPIEATPDRLVYIGDCGRKTVNERGGVIK